MSESPFNALGSLIVPSPSDPMAVARQFVAEHYMGSGRRPAAAPSPQHVPPLRRRSLARGRRAPRPVRALAVARERAYGRR